MEPETSAPEASLGPPAREPVRGPARLVYLAIGWGAVGLGVAGAFLPLLPTTPFVIVAAWAFAKSSPRLHAALHRHPRLGPALRDWELHRAIPRRAKWVAVGGMATSWALIVAASDSVVVPAVAGVVMLGSGAYVVTRPAPPRPPSGPSAPE